MIERPAISNSPPGVTAAQTICRMDRRVSRLGAGNRGSPAATCCRVSAPLAVHRCAPIARSAARWRGLPRGLAGVVLRHDGEPGRAALGRELAEICRSRRLALVVAGDVRLAAALGAGVHLRAGRWPGAAPPRLSPDHQFGPRACRSAPGETRRSGVGLPFPGRSPPQAIRARPAWAQCAGLAPLSAQGCRLPRWAASTGGMCAACRRPVPRGRSDWRPGLTSFVALRPQCFAIAMRNAERPLRVRASRLNTSRQVRLPRPSVVRLPVRGDASRAHGAGPDNPPALPAQRGG